MLKPYCLPAISLLPWSYTSCQDFGAASGSSPAARNAFLFQTKQVALPLIGIAISLLPKRL